MEVSIIDTNDDNIQNFGMCGYKNIKHEGYKNKIQWCKNLYSKGLKYKILQSDEDGSIGGIEYIPGKYTWRAINAEGYYVIHCLYIMLKKYKGKGYGELLLNECIKDAKDNNKDGIAVVTRKGSWMVSKDLFVKKGFTIVDKTEPDFELLVIKLNEDSPTPHFKKDFETKLQSYDEGLYIIVSKQCPYAYKSSKEIIKCAKNDYNLNINVIELEDSTQSMEIPCAFGCFCIIYNNKVVADHPISKTRFKNILSKVI